MTVDLARVRRARLELDRVAEERPDLVGPARDVRGWAVQLELWAEEQAEEARQLELRGESK